MMHMIALCSDMFISECLEDVCAHVDIVVYGDAGEVAQSVASVLMRDS